MDYEMEIRKLDHNNEKEKQKMMDLLDREGIRLDQFLEYSVGVFQNDRLLATGSFYKNTLRCLAVDKDSQGLGLMNRVVTHLQDELVLRGEHHFFIYTKSAYGRLFEELGYYTIAKVEPLVVFMENRPDGIGRYIDEIQKKRIEAENVAFIAMNANPFTKGHLHLVDRAARENDVLHLFVVTEEASAIPFKTRFELIKRGTAHLNNVVMHEAGEYMISKSTFPSYFFKDETEAVRAHARLDLEIFVKHIVPVLGIKKRYVGEEPYCEVTRTYVETMKTVLESNGIVCEIVPRKETEKPSNDENVMADGNTLVPISASMVRQWIRENKLEEIRAIVPETTYDYFKSEAGQELIEKIKGHSGRH